MPVPDRLLTSFISRRRDAGMTASSWPDVVSSATVFTTSSAAIPSALASSIEV
jgi:hypothetical protein